MRTNYSTCLSAVLLALVTAASVPSQNLPKTWNRSKDWVALKNPSPDSMGNLVWSCRQSKLGTPSLSTKWSTSWSGWVYHGLRWSGGGPITRSTLYHLTHNSLSPIVPNVWFTNTTKTPFMMAINGSLNVTWVSSMTAPFPLVRVEILFSDTSNFGQITTLLKTDAARPSLSGTLTIPVKIPAFRLDPDDIIIYRLVANFPTRGFSDRVELDDTKLQFTRTSNALATETARFASPRNPLNLSKGRTTRPLLGKTWNPYLANSPSGAQSTLLAVGVTKLHVALPFGILLTDPLLVLTNAPNVDFALPIPNNTALAGVKGSLQCASIAASGGILLSNALDFQIGDF